jgi:hypothetical protein
MKIMVSGRHRIPGGSTLDPHLTRTYAPRGARNRLPVAEGPGQANPEKGEGEPDTGKAPRPRPARSAGV